MSGISSGIRAAAAVDSDWQHGPYVREFTGHKKKVHTVAWNCTGSKLASGSVDQSVRVWTLDEGGRAVPMELKGHTDSVDQLRWDPKQAEVLGTASGDKTVRIWDARSGKCAHAIETRGENINIRWSPDGKHIAVGDKEDHITLIETRKCKTLHSIKFAYEVNEMAWDPSAKLFLLATGSGCIDIFDYTNMVTKGSSVPARRVMAHTANCYCIEFDPSGVHFAVGSADALVSLWNLQELVCVRTFASLEWPVRTLSFSHDSAYIAAGSEDPFIDISYVDSGRQAHRIPCNAPMNTVAWHPSRHLLAFAGDEKDRMGKDEGSLRVFGFSEKQ